MHHSQRRRTTHAIGSDPALGRTYLGAAGTPRSSPSALSPKRCVSLAINSTFRRVASYNRSSFLEIWDIAVEVVVSPDFGIDDVVVVIVLLGSVVCVFHIFQVVSIFFPSSIQNRVSKNVPGVASVSLSGCW